MHWFPVVYRCNLNWLLLDNVQFLLNNRHTYLICCIFLISPRPLDHPVFVPKIKLNFGKRDLSLAAPNIWNELPITTKSSETIATFRKQQKQFFLISFHHKFSAVPCFNDDFYLSPFMITPNDFVGYASVLDFLKGIGAIEILQLFF